MLRLGLPALHPWFEQHWRTLLRSRPSLRESVAWALALGMLAFMQAMAGVSSALLRLVAALPGPGAILIALIVGTLASRRLSLLATELDSSWLAALPIPRARAIGAIFFVALGHVMVGLAAWSLLAMTAWLDSHEGVGLSFLPWAAGLFAGMGLALWRALRTGRAHSAPRAGRREPAFALTTSVPLSPLLHWQRRAVVLQWRLGQGGHFWLVGAMLVLLPDRIGLRLAAGVLLMVVPWLWASLALRTSLRVGEEAFQLLRATPAEAATARRAMLRYPAIALALAMAMASVGNLLLGFSLLRMLGWVVALAVVILPAATCMSRAIRSTGK